MKNLNMLLMAMFLVLVAPAVRAQDNAVDNQEEINNLLVNDEGYAPDDAEYYKSESMDGNEVLPPEAADMPEGNFELNDVNDMMDGDDQGMNDEMPMDNEVK